MEKFKNERNNFFSLTLVARDVNRNCPKGMKLLNWIKFCKLCVGVC